MAQFELQVRVEDYSDPVNKCSDEIDICALYIDDICLGPQIEDDESCSLKKNANNVDLDDDDLPKTRTLTVESQPWPVSEVSYLYVYKQSGGECRELTWVCWVICVTLLS